jgi:TonB family protein
VCTALLVLAGAPAVAAAEPAYFVVVHPENPSTTLPSEQVSRMLLKTAVNWPHGPLVEPVDLQADHPARQAFSEEIHGRAAAAVQSAWQQQVLAGGRVPPLELADDRAVVAFVRQRPGAIGYVSGTGDTTGVKVVPVVYAPRRTHYEPPRYTPVAQRARVQGEVVLELTVGADGRVTHVEVLRGLPHGLSQQAVAAARRWRFEPAHCRGVAVETRVEYRVRFSL